MRCRKSHPKTRRMGYSVCTVANEQVDFGDLSDGELILKAIVIHSHVIGNIHDNPELKLK